MHKQLIEYPVILAICGKSAVGKDTLAKFLTKYFLTKGLFAHNMISVTTRPPRQGEVDEVDYYFKNEAEFSQMLLNNELIESTNFRGWYYGIPYSEVKKGYINIGVFNIEGLQSLQKHYNLKYKIIPIYLAEKLSIRLKRSHDRENKWRVEFFRRAITDTIDFRNIHKFLCHFNNGLYISLEGIEGVWKQSLQIEKFLRQWKILCQNENQPDKLRLGDFI